MAEALFFSRFDFPLLSKLQVQQLKDQIKQLQQSIKQVGMMFFSVSVAVSWRITPLSKWLVKGDLLTMVIKHLHSDAKVVPESLVL